MRLPFLQRDGHGLYLTPYAVQWCTIRTTRRALMVRHTDREPVVDGHVEEALQKVLDRLPTRPKYVVANMARQHVRHRLLQGPALEEEEAVAAWLDAEAQKQIPTGWSAGAYRLRTTILAQTEACTRCIMGLASEGAVQARLKVLATAGLQPAGLVSADLALEQVAMLAPGFANSTTIVIGDYQAEGVALRYVGGHLEQFAVLDDEPWQVTEGAQTRGQLRLQAAKARWTEEGVREAGEDERICIVSEESKTSEALGPAAALALVHARGTWNVFDFLDEETAVQRRQAVDKDDARHTLFGISGLLILLVAGSIGGEVWLDRRHQAVRAQLRLMADQVQEIEAARIGLDQLEADVRQAEEMVQARTHVAHLLHAIGSCIPADVWLDDLQLDTHTSGDLLLTINGLAVAEDQVALYLDRLERISEVRSVRLVYTEVQSARRLYREADVSQGLTLTQFEIRMTTGGE